MVTFEGELSEKCKMETAKRRSKNVGIIMLTATIVVAIIAIFFGILNDTLIYAVIVILLFLIPTIGILFAPTSKRMIRIKTTVKITVDNDLITETASQFGQVTKTAKPISKIKKVIDVGEWYYIVPKFGDVTNSWVCEKSLLKSGTLEEFEKIFERKLVRERKKDK